MESKRKRVMLNIKLDILLIGLIIFTGILGVVVSKAIFVVTGCLGAFFLVKNLIEYIIIKDIPPHKGD